MDLNFSKVTYEGDLTDFSEEEKIELIHEFENAQDSNVAEFETAAETLEGVGEADIEEFADARESLIESITDADAFSEVPLSEDALENCSFDELQDWQEFIEETGASGDETGDGGEQEFDDMGEQAPTHGEEDDEDAKFVEEHLDISGVNFK